MLDRRIAHVPGTRMETASRHASLIERGALGVLPRRPITLAVPAGFLAPGLRHSHRALCAGSAAD